MRSSFGLRCEPASVTAVFPTSTSAPTSRTSSWPVCGATTFAEPVPITVGVSDGDHRRCLAGLVAAAKRDRFRSPFRPRGTPAAGVRRARGTAISSSRGSPSLSTAHPGPPGPNAHNFSRMTKNQPRGRVRVSGHRYRECLQEGATSRKRRSLTLYAAEKTPPTAKYGRCFLTCEGVLLAGREPRRSAFRMGGNPGNSLPKGASRSGIPPLSPYWVWRNHGRGDHKAEARAALVPANMKPRIFNEPTFVWTDEPASRP